MTMNVSRFFLSAIFIIASTQLLSMDDKVTQSPMHAECKQSEPCLDATSDAVDLDSQSDGIILDGYVECMRIDFEKRFGKACGKKRISIVLPEVASDEKDDGSLEFDDISFDLAECK